MSNFAPNPRSHVLHVQDLVNIICDLLEMNDWLSLMRISKSTFPLVASRVWREVEGQVLTDLIVEVPSVASSDKLDNATVNFSRFDTYAPFVRQLRVYGRTARYIKGERRNACVSRAEKGELFPNVTSLTMLTSDLHHDSDALFWLDLFISPSVRYICIQPVGKTYTAWISTQTTYCLWERITAKCPTVETLEFYPADITRSGNSRADRSTNMLWSPTSSPNFGALTQLVRITTTIQAIHGTGLAALGSLPQLRFLVFHESNNSSEGLDLTVSDESFPRLTQLNLISLDNDRLLALTGTKPLMNRITTLKINQAPRGHGFNPIPEDGLENTLSLLLQHTERLKSFHYTAPIPKYSNLTRFEVDPTGFLQAMSKNPLQQVHIFGLCFIGVDFVAKIVAALPKVTILRMPSQVIPSPQLLWLSQMSSIRHLSLRYIMFTEIPLQRRGPTSPQLRRLESVVVVPEYDGGYIAEVARLLLTIWPGLEKIDYLPDRDREWSTWDPPDINGLVNSEIAKLREEGGIVN